MKKSNHQFDKRGIQLMNVFKRDANAEKLHADEKPLEFRAPYPSLYRWPDLKPALTIHLGLGKFSPRMPLGLMREWGFNPTQGMNIFDFEGKLLIRNASESALYRVRPYTQFMVRKSAVKDIEMKDFAVIQGPDYVVVASEEVARSMAPEAEIMVHQDWVRINPGFAEMSDEEYTLDAPFVLARADSRVYQTNAKRVSPIATLTTSSLDLAGLATGTPVRVKRFQNASVIERCAIEESHFTIRSKAKRLKTIRECPPSQYIGPSIFDVHDVEAIRFIAFPGRIVITDAKSELAQRMLELPVVGGRHTPLLMSLMSERADSEVKPPREEAVAFYAHEWVEKLQSLKPFTLDSFQSVYFGKVTLNATHGRIRVRTLNFAGIAEGTPLLIQRLSLIHI